VFKNNFKFDTSMEDVEDVQIELSAGYEKWYKENFPESKRRPTPANIRVSDFLTYMGTITKSETLPNLIQEGVADISTWRLNNLKMPALKKCREFLSSDKAA
jgi:hypothetical protein